MNARYSSSPENPLEWEEQWQDEHHDYAYDDLKRQAYFDVIHECITARLHHQGIRRCRERRGEAHACSQRYGKKERGWI